MKKVTALLLCFLLLCMCGVTALAAELEDETTSAVISVTVPDTHKINVEAEMSRVFYEGFSGDEFVVGRLSEPRLLIRPESGKVIKSVMLNGVDVTELVHGGYLELDPVYEDKVIVVTTEDEPEAPKDTFTVKGKVTLNGQPLADVDLELRSTLKTTKTDENGTFVFTGVEPGEHSLTALLEDKVIGYLSFELIQDDRTDVVLESNGTYTVTVDKDGAGIELHLVLNEEMGMLAIEKAVTLQKPVPQTGDGAKVQLWLILMIASAVCIVVIETYRRKTRNKNE